ncbi:A disintegrin and metalloproteinase with thrombospondin motifs 20 [Myotis davidii]|uniref:A disintegrin and metalloproteinase with thrombospondin motifs 20 n=1 Tax=Myotis davidii TaxID=225400 RepID=L5MDJ1_MYODS|nr:A disintegrin and metalloproteinase with thrombospondin motifs 20 [Myotis davidii]
MDQDMILVRKKERAALLRLRIAAAGGAWLLVPPVRHVPEYCSSSQGSSFVASSQTHPHRPEDLYIVPFPVMEALVRTLTSYEVVTPARVNEFGEVFPQSHHFSRRKRSSEAPEPPPFRTHYRISAYGQLFQLNLSADAAFLAEGFTEVHLGTPARGAEESRAVSPGLRHCFYRGQVNAREDHIAVFSLCGGLVAAIYKDSSIGNLINIVIVKLIVIHNEQKQCRRLWCTSAEGVHKGCRTQHMPLADGTNCGPGMHCHHGLCVNKEMETRPVDGEWGPWGPYSSCSRTCGGGIKSTTRLCNRPEPRNGGKYCVGRRMKFRSCNTDSCPKGKQDFREKQCSDFDGKHFNINGLSPNVRWLPKYSGIAIKDRCKLYCRVAGTTNFYQLKDRVADGTPCGTETNDICVQGLCRYRSFTALSDTQGNFLLNGNFVVSMAKKEIHVQGAIFEYSGSNSSTERINSTDRLEEELVLQCTATCGHGYQMRAVKCVDELLSAVLDDRLCYGASRPSDRQDCIMIPCPVIPKTGTTSLPAVPMGKTAQWRYGSWTPCSASCGHGKTNRQVLCIKYHQPINENHCDPEVRPSAEQECNVAACQPSYSNFPSSSEQPNHFPGRNFPLTHKPEDNEKWGVHPSIRGNQWRTGPWGSCSSSCAGGVQRRVVVCQDENGQSAHYCDVDAKPPEAKHCDTGPCPQWNYGSWGEDSRPSEGGRAPRGPGSATAKQERLHPEGLGPLCPRPMGTSPPMAATALLPCLGGVPRSMQPVSCPLGAHLLYSPWSPPPSTCSFLLLLWYPVLPQALQLPEQRAETQPADSIVT